MSRVITASKQSDVTVDILFGVSSADVTKPIKKLTSYRTGAV